MPELTVLTAGWNGQVLGELPLPVRSKWRGGSWAGIVDGRARFVTPNEWHKRACDEGRLEVEKALAAHFGQRIPVEVVIGEDANGAPGPAPTGRPAPGNAAGTPNEPDDHDETLSPDEVRQLKDAGDVATGGVDLLLREFGGELVEEDPS
jgi:hypothetical protein